MLINKYYINNTKYFFCQTVFHNQAFLSGNQSERQEWKNTLQPHAFITDTFTHPPQTFSNRYMLMQKLFEQTKLSTV